MATSSHAGHIIRAFLCDPDAGFEPFFRFSLSRVTSRLQSLARLGYPLPTDGRTDKNEIEELALDIVGALLASKPSRRYHIVFDCLVGRGSPPLDQMADSLLIARYYGLLRNFIRQELFRLRRSAEPQLGQLTRRINEVFGGEGYRQISYCGRMLVALRSSPLPAGDIAAQWDESELEQIAYRAYTARRSDWCRVILTLVAEARPDCPYVEVSQLIRVIIRVNKALVEMYLGELSSVHQPAVPEHLRRQAREAALQEVRSVVLPGFVRKGRLTTSESAVHLKAVARYLDDWLVHGDGADLKPVYLREIEPGITAEVYKRYKYTFERATAVAVEIAREIMRKHL